MSPTNLLRATGDSGLLGNEDERRRHLHDMIEKLSSDDPDVKMIKEFDLGLFLQIICLEDSKIRDNFLRNPDLRPLAEYWSEKQTIKAKQIAKTRPAPSKEPSRHGNGGRDGNGPSFFDDNRETNVRNWNRVVKQDVTEIQAAITQIRKARTKRKNKPTDKNISMDIQNPGQTKLISPPPTPLSLNLRSRNSPGESPVDPLNGWEPVPIPYPKDMDPTNATLVSNEAMPLYLSSCYNSTSLPFVPLPSTPKKKQAKKNLNNSQLYQDEDQLQEANNGEEEVSSPLSASITSQGSEVGDTDSLNGHSEMPATPDSSRLTPEDENRTPQPPRESQMPIKPTHNIKDNVPVTKTKEVIRKNSQDSIGAESTLRNVFSISNIERENDCTPFMKLLMVAESTFKNTETTSSREPQKIEMEYNNRTHIKVASQLDFLKPDNTKQFPVDITAEQDLTHQGPIPLISSSSEWSNVSNPIEMPTSDEEYTSSSDSPLSSPPSSPEQRTISKRPSWIIPIPIAVSQVNSRSSRSLALLQRQLDLRKMQNLGSLGTESQCKKTISIDSSVSRFQHSPDLISLHPPTINNYQANTSQWHIDEPKNDSNEEGLSLDSHRGDVAKLAAIKRQSTPPDSPARRKRQNTGDQLPQVVPVQTRRSTRVNFSRKEEKKKGGASRPLRNSTASRSRARAKELLYLEDSDRDIEMDENFPAPKLTKLDNNSSLNTSKPLTRSQKLPNQELSSDVSRNKYTERRNTRRSRKESSYFSYTSDKYTSSFQGSKSSVSSQTKDRTSRAGRNNLSSTKIRLGQEILPDDSDYASDHGWFESMLRPTMNGGKGVGREKMSSPFLKEPAQLNLNPKPKSKSNTKLGSKSNSKHRMNDENDEDSSNPSSLSNDDDSDSSCPSSSPGHDESAISNSESSGLSDTNDEDRDEPSKSKKMERPPLLMSRTRKGRKNDSIFDDRKIKIPR